MLIAPVGPNLDSIITYILTSALIAWQPDCSTGTKTPEKVRGKPIHAIVVDVSSGHVNHFRNLHDSMGRDHPLIIDRILMEVESHNQMYHESAARMICTQDGRDTIAAKKGKSSLPEHVFQVATMVDEEDIDADFATVKEKLDTKLARHIEAFRRLTCAK